MPDAVRGQATVQHGGLVYAFGGESTQDEALTAMHLPGIREAAAYNTAVHAYDAKTDTWTSRTNMPVGAYALSAHALGDKIYVFSGYAVNGFDSTVQVYDPKADAWTQSTPRPTSSYTFVSEAVGGRVYVIGCQGPSATDPSVWPYRDDVEIFEPQTGWTRGARLPKPVSGAASCSLGDRIFVFGGDVNNLTSIYDVKADRWSSATPPPTARTSRCSAAGCWCWRSSRGWAGSTSTRAVRRSCSSTVAPRSRRALRAS
jgi:N-acetylneuraminic acid mutarotase